MPVLKISQDFPQAKSHPLTASHSEEIVEGFHSFVSAFIPQHGREITLRLLTEIRPWAFCHYLPNREAANGSCMRHNICDTISLNPLHVRLLAERGKKKKKALP